VDIANQQISRSRGVTAFGLDGYQQIYSQYNSSFNFVSSLIPYEDSISLPISQAVDSCWTSGNIFRLDASSGLVVKTNFQNEELSSLSLSAPNSLSVIQSVVPMADENPTDEEGDGCWVVSGTSLFRLDSNLNIEVEIVGLSSPSLVCVNHATQGCFVVDEDVGIYEFDFNGDLVGTGIFTDNHILGVLSNSEGDLYLLTEEELYKFTNIDGNLSQNLTHGLPGYFGALAVGCFDIDTSTDYVYVGGGNNTTLRLMRFDSSGSSLGSSSISGSFPYIIRVSQHPSSNTFFILADDQKIDFVESSSSESSELYSEPSSSSSEGFSESSSDSSPSSFGFSSDSSPSSGSSSSSEKFSESSSSEQFSEPSSSSSSFLDDCDETKVTASDGGGSDLFGGSVSIDGNYAVVGAVGEDSGGSNSGAAYIYRRTDTNAWADETKIVASDAAAGDLFGTVDIDGDYVIVGAKHESTGLDIFGAAYIFRRTGLNTWDSGTKIVASDREDGDLFGTSVSISGNYAIVGANGEDAGGSGAGAAYIFRRTDTNTWDSGTKIVASDAAAGDNFGVSVSIDGDYAIVGAKDESSAQGAAYIFRRTGTNAWADQTKITATDGEASDLFGISVSIDGDYVAIGASLDDDNGSQAGAAYVYRRTGTNAWADQTKITASDGAIGDTFGESISIKDDYVVVGAENEGSFNEGAAYIFRRTDTNTWNEELKLETSDRDNSDKFGTSVSVDESYIVVGSPGDNSDTGASHMFFCEDMDSESSSSEGISSSSQSQSSSSSDN
jgi:hypothetical protein